MRQIVETLLPTTMVGSYPRPRWFHYQLLGRDIRVAFKHVDHAEAFADATRVVIQDQEAAGLDIVTDGQMYFDDYMGAIGSFCWYIAATPKSEVKRHRASGHSNDCMPVPPGSYSASNFAGAAVSCLSGYSGLPITGSP